MLKVDVQISENTVNNWLDVLEQDRKKFFDDVKNNKSTDVMKEQKIKNLECIQKQLLSYKRLLTKEKDDKEKY